MYTYPFGGMNQFACPLWEGWRGICLLPGYPISKTVWTRSWGSQGTSGSFSTSMELDKENLFKEGRTKTAWYLQECFLLREVFRLEKGCFMGSKAMWTRSWGSQVTSGNFSKRLELDKESLFKEGRTKKAWYLKEEQSQHGTSRSRFCWGKFQFGKRLF